MRLVLASTSPYRRALLERLGLEFVIARPRVDETPVEGEAAAALSQRLARAKAAAVAATEPAAWVVGSDQVADPGDGPLGKPGSRAAAVAQLARLSGREVRFHTAVSVLRADGPALQALDTTTVRFRSLSREEIDRYVDADQPFDCAGSFKAEALGITLFESIRSDDPTALVGLPLIATARLLREAGFRLP